MPIILLLFILFCFCFVSAKNLSTSESNQPKSTDVIADNGYNTSDVPMISLLGCIAVLCTQMQRTVAG